MLYQDKPVLLTSRLKSNLTEVGFRIDCVSSVTHTPETEGDLGARPGSVTGPGCSLG